MFGMGRYDYLSDSGEEDRVMLLESSHFRQTQIYFQVGVS